MIGNVLLKPQVLWDVFSHQLHELWVSNSVTDLYRAVPSSFSPSCCKETQIQSRLRVSLFPTRDEETARISAKTDTTVHLWWNSFNLVVRHFQTASPAASFLHRIVSTYRTTFINTPVLPFNGAVEGVLESLFCQKLRPQHVSTSYLWIRCAETKKNLCSHMVYVWIYPHVGWNPLVS